MTMTSSATPALLRRTMAADGFNALANAEEIRPWLGGKGPLDLSVVLSNPANVGLIGERGGFIAHKIDFGLYEFHSMFLPEGRGGYAVRCAREALCYVFTETDCIEAVTKVPEGNGGAKGLATILGFEKQFDLSASWPLPDGTLGACEHHSMTFSRWMMRDRNAKQWGKWFHERLEILSNSVGLRIPEHAEDEAHNRAVGAAIMMWRAGNAAKGCSLYNRWARFAGFPPAEIVQTNPVIIDMQGVVITMRDGDMELLKCQ